MSDLNHEEVEALRRLLAKNERKESLGDMASDDYFDQLFDRPHMMGALITLVPKNSESWTEDRLMLWLEVVEKTARLVYGLRSEWDDILGVESPPQKVCADAASDKIEAPSPPSPAAHVEGQVGGSDSSTSNDEEKSEQAAERSRLDLALEALEDGPLRLKDLADRIGAPSGSMSALADSLEGQGLAKSSWGENGARTVALVTTGEPEAQPAAEPKPPRRENLEAEVLQVLNDSYHVALKRKEIVERLDANPDSVTDVLARLVASKKVEKCGQSSGTSYRIPARAAASKTCTAKDCILAAEPGKELCGRHSELLERVGRATA